MTIKYHDKPFHHWVIDTNPGRRETDAIREIAQSITNEQQRWFRYDQHVQRKWVTANAGAVGGSVSRYVSWKKAVDLKLPTSLGARCSPALRSDPTAHNGVLNVMQAGDYVWPHIDRDLHPKLTPPQSLAVAVVHYLVPHWYHRWGGALELWDDLCENVVAAYYPLPGRTIVWLPGDTTFHGVQRIVGDCPTPRVSVNIFLYEPARSNAVRKKSQFVPPPS